MKKIIKTLVFIILITLWTNSIQFVATAESKDFNKIFIKAYTKLMKNFEIVTDCINKNLSISSEAAKVTEIKVYDPKVCLYPSEQQEFESKQCLSRYRGSCGDGILFRNDELVEYRVTEENKDLYCLLKEIVLNDPPAKVLKVYFEIRRYGPGTDSNCYGDILANLAINKLMLYSSQIHIFQSSRTSTGIEKDETLLYETRNFGSNTWICKTTRIEGLIPGDRIQLWVKLNGTSSCYACEVRNFRILGETNIYNSIENSIANGTEIFMQDSWTVYDPISSGRADAKDTEVTPFRIIAK